MADPDLTSTNCDGETETIQLGHDLGSATPNKRLGIVKTDGLTIIKDSAILPPASGGDLNGGIRVNYNPTELDANPDGLALRTCKPGNGIMPPVIGNRTPALAPAANLGDSQLLRHRETVAGADCGYFVHAPRMRRWNNLPRLTELPLTEGVETAISGNRLEIPILEDDATQIEYLTAHCNLLIRRSAGGPADPNYDFTINAKIDAPYANGVEFWNGQAPGRTTLQWRQIVSGSGVSVNDYSGVAFDMIMPLIIPAGLSGSSTIYIVFTIELNSSTNITNPAGADARHGVVISRFSSKREQAYYVGNGV